MSGATKYDRAIADREGARLAAEAADALLQSEIRSAKALDRMTRNFAFVYEGASSVVHFGGMLGLSRKKAIVLSSAGRAFRLLPEIEQRVATKALPLESAAALVMILDHPVLKEQAWEWLDRAAERTPEALSRAIRRAIAEEDAKTAVEPVTLLLKPEVRDKLGRAREVVSRKTAQVLTNEEVVEVTLDYFLEREDPDRVPEGTRRKGATVRDPSRAIPAAVKREALRRGAGCQVPGCSNHIFLNFCHIVDHAKGGSREADNLLILCWLHHWLFDHGRLGFRGTAEEPVFTNSRDEVIPGPGPPGG